MTMKKAEKVFVRVKFKTVRVLKENGITNY